MRRHLLFWYFAIYMSGGHVVGPFIDQMACEQERNYAATQYKGATSVSCWKDHEPHKGTRS